jgi:hypothetical protein
MTFAFPGHTLPCEQIEPFPGLRLVSVYGRNEPQVFRSSATFSNCLERSTPGSMMEERKNQVTGGKYLKMSEISISGRNSRGFSQIEEKSRDWCILPPVSIVVVFGPIIGKFGNLTH